MSEVAVHPARPLVWLVASGMVVASVSGVAAQNAGAAPKATQATVTTAAPATTGSRSVLLPDGRTVTLLASGSVLGDSGSALSYNQSGGSTQVTPVLSRSLSGVVDPAAYDLETLATLEASSKGNLPLSVRYTGTRPSLPGLTWTGTYAGYVTPSSASTFGKTLRTSTATGITRIALPGPVTVTPLYAMHTVKLRTITTGVETGANVYITNVDDVNKYQVNDTIDPGDDTRVSLPEGHYAATVEFEDRTNVDPVARLLVVPFTVSGDTTVTFDARTATSPVSVSTPRAATLGFTGYQINVLDPAGRASTFATYTPSSDSGQILVAPTPAGSPLKLQVQASFHLESDQSMASPYTYDLVYQRTSIAQNQHYVASAGSLAAVNARYYSDGAAMTVNAAMLPALRSPRADQPPASLALPFPVALGTSRTQYTSAGVYFSQVFEDYGQPGASVMNGNYQLYKAGSQPTLDLLRGPLHPGSGLPATPAWNITSPYALPHCALCRYGDNLEFGLFPLVDNGGHAGLRAGGTVNWSLNADGTEIASGMGDLGQGTSIEVDPEQTDYSVHYLVQRPDAGTSTRTDTTWTFSSATKTGTTSTAVACVDATPTSASYVTGCRTQDLLTTDFQLSEDLNDSEAVGPTSAQISVSPITGAARHPIRIFSAQVSFDGGATWQSTTAGASGSGTYQVTYDNPKGATAASLRVYARDSTGSTITQTIDRAYTVRGASTSS